MDQATVSFLGALMDVAKLLPQREASAIATACMVATVQGDAAEAHRWLDEYLRRGTGDPVKEKPGLLVPSNSVQGLS